MCMKAIPLVNPYSRLQQTHFTQRDPRIQREHGPQRLKSRRGYLAGRLEEPPANYPLSESLAGGISPASGPGEC
ncbi:hypothetical protein Trydic_g1180 [Trypoxylus dichotomus]